jgi:hypothetical protein
VDIYWNFIVNLPPDKSHTTLPIWLENPIRVDILGLCVISSPAHF